MNEKWKSRADISPKSSIGVDLRQTKPILLPEYFFYCVTFTCWFYSLRICVLYTTWPPSEVCSSVPGPGLGCGFRLSDTYRPHFPSSWSHNQSQCRRKRSQSTALPSAALPLRPWSSLLGFSFLCVTLALSFASLPSFVLLALGQNWLPAVTNFWVTSVFCLSSQLF